jgi:hypothetical protein
MKNRRFRFPVFRANFSNFRCRVTTSTANGADIPLGTQWVSPDALTVLNNAITNAKKVNDDNSATQKQADDTRYALESATVTFNAARKAGSATPVDRSDLDARIAGAESTTNGVITAADAAGAAQGADWATSAQLEPINAAIEEARNAKTQAEVTAALNKLTAALETFTNAVSGNPTGTKAIGFTQAEMDVLIAKANTAKTGATVAANGDNVPPTKFWVSEADLNPLNSAISAAGTLSDAAYLALLSALKIFDEAKKPGSLPEKTPLFNAIKGADTARADVNIAASKDQAPKDSEWVTQAQWDALDTVYTAALATAGNADATKNAVAEAVSALNTATAAFISAKNSNGFGTAVSGITISGLGTIYKNGASVQVGLLSDKNSEKPAVEGEGTVANGSLTVSLPGANGSYYIAFTSDEMIVFISKTTAAVSSTTISKAYNDFELYTWSMKGGDMDLTSPKTLNAIIQEMSQGYINNYAAFKANKQILSYMLPNSDDYVNLNFLNVALYKNEACTQEFSGTDQIGKDTVVYTKFPFADIMGGGGGGNKVEAAGYVNGTVTFTGYSGQRPEIQIRGTYTSQGIGSPIDGSGRGYEVNSDGSFSIPFTEEFLTALQSGAELSFWLNIGSGSSAYSKFIYPDIPVTANQLSGGNLNVGSLGTVVGSITLSGTITVTYNGQPVPNVGIYVDEMWLGMEGKTGLKSPGSNAAWSMTLSALDSPTDLGLSVDGYDSDMKNLFRKNEVITVPGVYNKDVTGLVINLEIRTVTLSGTIDVTVDGTKADTVSIMAYSEKGDRWNPDIGYAYIENYDKSNAWSMVVIIPSTETTVYFDVQIHTISGGGYDDTLPTTITLPYSGGPIALSYHGTGNG